SIRMEPVYMIMGQACATAASLAIDDGVDAQKVPYEKLRERLVADQQLVTWEGPARMHAGPKSSDLPGIVVDDSKAALAGEWTRGTIGGIDGGYLHDSNEQKGKKSARFEIKVPADGKYEVRFAYTP